MGKTPKKALPSVHAIDHLVMSHCQVSGQLDRLTQITYKSEEGGSALDAT